MRQQKHCIALIADEYGGVDGIITAEDIVEKVIGRLEEDKTQNAALTIHELEDGSVIAGGRVTISEFENKYGPVFSQDLKETDIDTLGGLVFYLAGYIPARHEIILHPSGIEFEIVDCSSRFITSLIIRNLPTQRLA
jgi:magnesium and cobalt transporter